MPAKTFTNEQLVQLWAQAKMAGGTRRDVVLGIMSTLGLSDTKDNYRKVYNNVTQRVKQLSNGDNSVKFPALAEGKKGARRAGADVANLQAILDNATTLETTPTE